MNIKVNPSIIKERCGAVSFKKGDSFYRNGKVEITRFEPDVCEATVRGTEDFHVTVEQEGEASFRTTCSCPKLASFQKECQHVAAVLLSVAERQKTGGNERLTEDFLNLFENKRRISSGQQLYFEKRKVLNAVFTCRPVRVDQDQHLMEVEVKVGPYPVKNIREVLKEWKKGVPSPISLSFTFDPQQHCFEKETNEVIEQLIHVMQDERVYMESMGSSRMALQPDTLVIPPSSWANLQPLLEKAPYVKLQHAVTTYEGIRTVTEPLSLSFVFSESEGGRYQLKIQGLKQMVVLSAYGLVLSHGNLYSLSEEDCLRLSELKRMMKASATEIIPIPKPQMAMFLEKVVPGLKRLGEVKLSDALAKQFAKTPLTAKLYLDRVKNRLLAGVEFHYDHVIINPLEENSQREHSTIIRDLEKENRILKIMEESQFAKTDGGYYLHNEELEYEFLYREMPRLQKFVQIYATTSVRNRIIRKSPPPQIRVKHKRERTNWLEFKFDIDGIPQKEISDILWALEEKRKYYRLKNGALLSLETREYEEIQRFLHAVPEQKKDLEKGFEVPVIKGLQLLDAADDSAFALEKSFTDFLHHLKNPDRDLFDLPGGWESVLRDYQKQGYRWMKTLASFGFGGILADDMGLGKTIQSLAFIVSELPTIRKTKKPALIVCPSSVTYNWLNECRTFAPEFKAVCVDGSQQERSWIQKNTDGNDVIITSYPLLRKDIGWYEKQSFHIAFFDEAQYFKNPITQTARAVQKINANHRFALTGTPVENSIEDVWSIFHIIFPELLGGLKDFSHLTRKKMSRRISPFLLRRIKEDVLAELPGKVESSAASELLPEQKKLYAVYLAKLRHETLKHLDKDTFRKNKIKILAGLTRLRQICCHPALFVDGYKESSAKFNQLLQIVEEARVSGRRVLIFSQFTKMLDLIGRELDTRGLSFFYLDGQTPSMTRVELCNRFNGGERDMFLISLKAGGTGLNLTGADTVILYDLWWNPAVEEQAADRAHRMGQTQAVQVIKLVARGTIEEKINELQDKKKNLIEELIGEKPSASLTEEDIREILMI
ncbi:Superfamily II DNA or RNA helicase, SNF2 family [Fictibacillus enclensis]|uniref:Helicase SNF n=1 Tax=Fictibacillus enclensis TaxID=1017270 RepID=A0A0V8JBT1_9BACL|nr:DEAD/DEAH box helicase [Fictibacillus enclensis]KSU84445.1 helicase SNF [Fictibacillus enclensis]SCB79623.1 Superfamily II DNA or RNA helicase, SNF2 family [Fictibacillus enclensis]